MDRNICLQVMSPAERSHRLTAEYDRHRADIDQRTSYYAAKGVNNVIDYWDSVLPLHSHRPFCRYVGASSSYTYQQAEEVSNQLSHLFLSHDVLSPSNVDVVHGRTTVALLMENCPHFLFTWMALAKLGCTIALINTSVQGAQLKAAIHTAQAKVVIVSKKLHSNWRTALAVMTTEERDQLIVLHSLGWHNESMRDEDGMSRTAPPSSTSTTASPSTSYLSLQRQDALDRVASPSIDSDDDDERVYFDEPDHLSTFPSTRLSSSFRQSLHLDFPLFYIFTSGTTGPSKAAYFSHRRFMGAGITWTYPMQLTVDDVYYIVLPLFHGNGGVVAVSACWNVGCEMVIRDKLSVRAFWPDVRRYGVTAMIHVGEVWRYLYGQPHHPDEDDNSLRVIAGNGLRADIWGGVVKRFGIELVVEHFGCTEMPAGPYMQWMGKEGACGFIPPQRRAQQRADKLIEFDVQSSQVVRRPPSPSSPSSSSATDLPGVCIEVAADEVGECIFKLAPGLTEVDEGDNPHVPSDTLKRSTDVNPHYRPYHGYTDDSASLKRVYRHVFSPYDAWFATGDLLRCDADGFFSFVDRTGDTYRWKGENVSTNEVSEVIAAFPAIAQANVYGVQYPGRDGKAGMVSVRLQGGVDEDSFDFHSLFSHCYSSLPPFAIPIFLRLTSSQIQETSTSKYQKFQYVKEGFDPSVVPSSDVLYTLDSQSCTYRRLTAQRYQRILEPSYRGYEVR